MLYTEPPAYPRPVTEAFGNVALATNEYAVAEQAFRSALDQEPGSGRAYFGLATALQHLGKADAAREARERALKAWATADANLPQLAGTSSSAPQVSATAAIVQAMLGGAPSPATVRNCIVANTDFVGDPNIFGSGRLNVLKAGLCGTSP